jgi:CHAT domain-containing protein
MALHTELLPASLAPFLPKNPEAILAIIPDGVLFNLPFAALMDQSKHFLVEQHTLTLGSSIAMLDSPPKYQGEFSLVMASSPNAAQGEAGVISSSFPGAVKLVGSNAEIGVLQEQARGKAIVYLADNMQISSNPLNAVIPVSSREDRTGKPLSVNRLFSTTLPNDLLVLSGTTVNAKDVQGSAVKLFSRGLNYAGVRNVLMSLWNSPNAQRTNELLSFYKGQSSGMTQAQPLRRAQLAALQVDRSPRSWASFQLVGPGF